MKRHFFDRSFCIIGFWLAAVTATCGFTSFLRAASQEEERAPIKIFFADNISAAHQKVIARFNTLHRGRIEVVPVDLPFTKFSTNERKALLARSLRSKSDRIDVFAVDLIWVSRFAKWSEKLDVHFPTSARRNILSHALQSCYFDSTLVALPFYIDISVLYYRRDLLRNLPNFAELESKLQRSITWSEFLALGEQMQTRALYLFQADAFEGLMCSYLEVLAGMNQYLYRDGVLQLHSPEAAQALQFLIDLIHKHKVSPTEVVEFREHQSQEYLLKQQGVFLRAWPGFRKEQIAGVPPELQPQNLGVATLPHFAGAQPRAIIGGWNVMISKYSTHRAEALEFVKFLLGEEAQKIMFETGGYLPTNNRVYEDSLYLQQQPELSYFRHLLDTGFHRPQLPNYTTISDILSLFLHRALRRELTAEQALKQAALLINSPKAQMR